MQLNRNFFVLAALIATIIGWWAWRRTGSDWLVLNDPPRGKRVAAFGDSLTLGHGAPSGASYPAQLARLIDAEVINLGRSGDTTADAARRIKSLPLETFDIALVTLGGNDLLQQVTLDKTLANLESIFATLTDHGILVIYGGISPPLVGDNWLLAIEQLCKERGVAFAGDIMRDLWRDDSMMADQIHPNAAGYRVIAERFHVALKPYL